MVKSLAVLPEDVNFSAAIVYTVPGNPTPSSGLCTHVVYKHAYRQNVHLKTAGLGDTHL